MKSTSFSARLTLAAFSLIVLTPALLAQRTHRNNNANLTQGLIGELPLDVSNWPHPAAPDGNPYPRSTASIADLRLRRLKEQLGKTLFWEEQMSSDNTVSCGTCHIMSSGGTDDRLGAVAPNGNFGAFGMIPQHEVSLTQVDYGHVATPSANIDRLVTGVHTPTMIGAYMFNQLFWDMRAGNDFEFNGGGTIPTFDDWAACEDLAVGPPVSDIEMGHEGIDWGNGFIQQKLGRSFPLALVDPATIPPDILFLVNANANYDRIFNKIFFSDPMFGGALGVTRERFAMAIAHYMRSLIPDRAPIDRGTMTPQQIAGFNRMRSAGCFVCHSSSGNPTLNGSGILSDPFDNPLSDGRFHNIGFGSVKTPTLRNVGLRVKFFTTGQGNGGLNSIDDIINFYENQPGITGFGGPLPPAEFAAVKDFLENALTDPRVANESFPFDRPELASERPNFSPFESNEFGFGTPGPSGLTPEIIANAPPLVLGPTSSLPIPTNWFKVGVGNSPGLRPAFLLVSPTSALGPFLFVGPSFTIPITTTTNAQGIATAHFPFPLTSFTLGVPFFTQWVINDSGVRAFSNAARFVPFMF